MEFQLNYFSDDPRVGSVSGNCLLTQGNGDFSFYYSRLNHIWGWGTWRRAWNSYSVSVKDDDKTIYSVLKNVFFLKIIFKIAGLTILKGWEMDKSRLGITNGLILCGGKGRSPSFPLKI